MRHPNYGSVRNFSKNCSQKQAKRDFCELFQPKRFFDLECVVFIQTKFSLIRQPKGSTSQWACLSCTTVNSTRNSVCVICRTKRPKPAPVGFLKIFGNVSTSNFILHFLFVVSQPRFKYKNELRHGADNCL